MPPSASKSTLTPAELAQLEHAFATDPTSDAYKPLAEAYLSMGRFMEAMVVCKKGVKAHPDAVSARVLLAKVYAEQGKDKKALEELQGALAVAPTDTAALRMCGGLLCKTGDLAGGTERLKKALAADPKNPDTIELCKKYGVELPAPPPPPVQAPVRQPSAQSGAGAVAGPGLQAPLQAGTPQPGFANAQQFQQPRQQRPRPQPRPVAPAISYEELAAKYEREDSVITRRKSSGVGVIITVGVILAGALSLGGYFYWRKVDGERRGKIAKLMTGMQSELSHDSFASYKKACEYGEQIVSDLDPSLFSAHAFLAYAYAIRWGEHGEDTADRAKDHLTKAKAANQEHSHIAAAEAYIRFFGGDTKAAEDDLSKIVEDATAKGRQSALLLGVLGILQMRDGDLDNAQKSLKAANTISPADPRIAAALGDVLRFQGNEFLAAKYYEDAMRYEKDHAEAQLGVALMAIDTGKFDTAEKFVSRLLTLDPPPSPRQMAVAHMAKAIILDEGGKTSEADKESTLATETDSRNPELFILKAHLLARRNKIDEAIAAVREAIKRDAKRASFHAELARLLMTKPGGAKEAVEAVRKAIASTGESVKLLLLLGDCQRAAEDFDGARSTYEKALSVGKGKAPDATLGIAETYKSKKDWNKALEFFEKAKNEFMLSAKKQAYCLTEMGKIIEEQQNDKKKALDTYKAAQGADASYPPPYFLIAKFFALDKDPAKRETAYTLLEKYLEYDPKGEYAEKAKEFLKDRKPAPAPKR